VELENNSAINIGAGLNMLGKKVLLIDLDPQANLSQSLGLINQEKTIYGALKGEYKLQPVSVLKGLDVIPSTLDLSGAEIELSSEPGREYILKELIEHVRSSYDYIIIDSPPSLGRSIHLLQLMKLSFHCKRNFLAMQGLAK
jgi:chromosome partitioning protein